MFRFRSAGPGRFRCHAVFLCVLYGGCRAVAWDCCGVCAAGKRCRRLLVAVLSVVVTVPAMSLFDAVPESLFDAVPDAASVFGDGPQDVPAAPAVSGPRPLSGSAVEPAGSGLSSVRPVPPRVVDPGLVDPGLLKGLNPEQAAAVMCLNGPLAVVAGPGSGKTRVLTCRVAALVAAGADPSSILAVTFTNKAADEMRSRIAVLVGESAVSRMRVGTFHSVCLRLLRFSPAAAGLRSGFSVVDSTDSEKYMKRALVSAGLSDVDDPSSLRRLARDWQSKVGFAKNRLLTPERLAVSSLPAERELGLVMAAYQSELGQVNGVDFDDILSRCLLMLETDTGLRDRLRARFAFVLVDEYQDTNVAQYRILRELVPPGGNLCVVGDQQQSIYSWRAATPEVLGSFVGDWDDAEMVVLEENYRSSPEICAVAEAVMAADSGRFAKGLWTRNPSAGLPRLVTVADDRAEAGFVASGVVSSSLPFSDHAVLFRTNAQSRSLETELTKRGVPYHVVGSVKFFERAEVRDALAHVRFALNPFDVVSFRRAAAAPRIGVGEVALAAVEGLAVSRGAGLFEALSAGLSEGLFPSRARRGLGVLAASCAAVVEGCGLDPVEGVSAALSATGLRASFVSEPERVENLDELLNAAGRFVSDSAAAVDGVSVVPLSGSALSAAFLESVALTEASDDISGSDGGPDVDDVGDGPGRVSLMTAHAAKGREFPCVWVVGCEDRLFPHARHVDDPAAVFEERRLFFVAVSRAESRLTLLRCRRRLLYGDPVEWVPSPFLDGLEGLVELVDLSGPSQRRFGSAAGLPRRRSSSVAVPAAGSAAGSSPLGGFGGRPAVRVRRGGPRLGLGDVAVGVVVSHSSFGEGRVVAVDAASGSVTVEFDGVRRVLSLALAPLSLLPR